MIQIEHSYIYSTSETLITLYHIRCNPIELGGEVCIPIRFDLIVVCEKLCKFDGLMATKMGSGSAHDV